jgi:hypothetical protein
MELLKTKNMDIGKLLANSFKPFLIPGIKKQSDVEPVAEGMANSINKAYQPLMDWVFEGKMKIGDFTYIKGVNDQNAMSELRKIYK